MMFLDLKQQYINIRLCQFSDNAYSESVWVKHRLIKKVSVFFIKPLSDHDHQKIVNTVITLLGSLGPKAGDSP